MMSLICRLRGKSHGDDGIKAADEIERLREALKKANEQTAHFEREWYLRGDALENLEVQATRGVAQGWVSIPEVEWDSIMKPNEHSSPAAEGSPSGARG